jgi:phytol kinase
LPLAIVEITTRMTRLQPEIARKFVHVGSAIMVIALSVICTLQQIAAIGIIFFVTLGLLRFKKLWRSLYGVQRRSLGELFFPLGVATAALMAGDRTVFIVAILIMGISDTAASLVGQRLGGKWLILIKNKSAEGSVTFLVVSITILLACSSLPVRYVIVVGLVLTVIELMSVDGADNLTIPTVAVLLLNKL